MHRSQVRVSQSHWHEAPFLGFACKLYVKLSHYFVDLVAIMLFFFLGPWKPYQIQQKRQAIG